MPWTARRAARKTVRVVLKRVRSHRRMEIPAAESASSAPNMPPQEWLISPLQNASTRVARRFHRTVYLALGRRDSAPSMSRKEWST